MVVRKDEGGRTRRASLQLFLLGAPRITLHGAPLDDLTSAKAQALLFYLAVTGRTHTRAALAGLLWGDFPQKAARGNLRKALQHLREHLQPYLAIDRHTLALAPDADVWVDVAAFDAALQDAAVEEAPDRAERALDLYRGDFLAGFYVRKASDFENWALAERARLQETMFDGLHALADYHADAGDLEHAVALIRRSLELEPWREEAHRRLMTWLALDGQRGAALAQFDICRQTLAEELGVEPAEETTALYQRIRDGELRSPVVPPMAPTIEPEPPAFLDQTVEPAEAAREPFVGRQKELDRLAGFLDRALAGRGRVAFVRGEAGWGKTRLLDAFSRRAQEEHDDLIVASGTCTTFTGSGDPYLPFREMVRMLCADVEHEWTAGTIAQRHALRLWQSLPVMVEALASRGRHLIDRFVPGDRLLRRSAAHPSISPDLLARLQDAVARAQQPGRNAGVDQERIFEEVADVLQAASVRRPLLLILDDLHWADASSIGLLFHLGRRLMESPVLILGAYRPEDVSVAVMGREHPLTGVLREFQRLFGDIWVDLGPGEGEGRAFVDALLDSEPNRFGDGFRARLTENTGGHPLFTVEMLRDLRERGEIYQDEAGRWAVRSAITWDTLPERVEAVIERRVNRVEGGLRRALAAASVEGETFTAEVVARVCQTDEGEMVGLLSGDLSKVHRLVRASGIRRLDGRRLSRYRFSHNLFQKHLYHGLDAVERAYLHEAVGEALETVYGDQTEEVAVQLATHFEESGRLHKAVAYLKEAAESAAAVYANPEAIDHYSRAVELTREIGGDGEELTSLYSRLGRILELDSQFDRALSVYREMGRVAQRRGDRRMELASLMARAACLAVVFPVHDAERARALGERALALADALGDEAAKARILWSLCLADRWAGGEGVECGERSLDLARKLDLRDQTAQTLNDLGSLIYLYAGRLDQAKAALREASELWRELGDLPMLADSLSSSATAHVFSGDYDQAIALSDEALELSRSIDNVWGQAYSLWKVGYVFWDRGEVSRAIDVMETSIRLAERAGFPAPQSHARTDMALLYGELGRVERGMEMAELALVHGPRVPLAAPTAGGEPEDFPDRPKIVGAMAHLHLLKGDLEQAEVRLAEAMESDYRRSWPVLSAEVVLVEGEVALARGAYERCVAVMDQRLADLRRWGLRIHLPQALYLKGVALQRSGREQAAREVLHEARDAAEAIGSRRVLWRILRVLARLEGDAAEAASLRREAREVIRYIVGHTDQTQLRASFLSLPEVRDVLRPGEA